MKTSRTIATLVSIANFVSFAKANSQCSFAQPLNNASCDPVISSTALFNKRKIEKGEYICTENKIFQFGLTNDGVLSICKNGTRVWSLGSNIKNANHVFFQKSGNLVLYTSSDVALWDTSTGGNMNSKLRLSDDGSLTLTNMRNKILWSVQPDISIQQPPPPISAPIHTPSISVPTPTPPTPPSPPSQPVVPITPPTPLVPTITAPTQPSFPSFPSSPSRPTTVLIPTYIPPAPSSSLNKCQFSSNPIESKACNYEISNSMSARERTLARGDFICSKDERYRFGVTIDGTLSICEGEERLWSEESTRNKVSFTTLHKNGNFVLYNSATQSIWETETFKNSYAVITVSNNGKATLSNGVKTLWAATTVYPTPQPTPMDPLLKCEFDPELLDELTCDGILTPDMPNSIRRMFVGEFICSPNKDFFFGMTLDNYLAICESGKKVWKAGPFSGKELHAHFKTNGNLAVYTTVDKDDPLWQVLFRSGTNEYTNSVLKLQDDGVLKIISAENEVVWERTPEEGPRTNRPTISPAPTEAPITSKPTISHAPIGSYTYKPGELQYNEELGIYLSVGLTGRLIAETGQRVQYWWGGRSMMKFHDQPDAGGCFDAEDGGWHYMSNSEVGDGEDPDGGVGRIKFNSNGDVVEYKMVLQGTRMNCGSGFTPWDSYITCEEFRGGENRPAGQCWEVHPEEKWQPRPTKMGGVDGGKFESAAFDSRNMRKLKGFVTTDSKDGPVLRFTPNPVALENALGSGDFSNLLHTDGFVEYLVVNNRTNTFTWSTDKSLGEKSAEWNYPNTEGIDAHDGQLYFITKKLREMYILDLDKNTYTRASTSSGAFNGQPDQIVRLLPDQPWAEDLLYFLEDGGNSPAGVFARDKNGKYFTIAEGGEDNSDESTGLAFCDGGRRMMFAFQDEGKLFEIRREDGLPFHGRSLDIKYHNV